MIILIAGDLEESRIILKTPLGHIVVTALNGSEALAMARSRAPDIILSDVLMPEMDDLSAEDPANTEKAARKYIEADDSGQLGQVLMNLAANACDTMRTGCVLTIATERAELDKAYMKTHGFGEPGPYAHNL